MVSLGLGLKGHRVGPLSQEDLDEPLRFPFVRWVYGLVRLGMRPSAEKAFCQN